MMIECHARIVCLVFWCASLEHAHESMLGFPGAQIQGPRPSPSETSSETFREPSESRSQAASDSSSAVRQGQRTRRDS